MGPVLFRLIVLTVGMGLVEIGLTDALGKGSSAGWGLALLAGLPLVLAGTAGFIGPLIEARRHGGDTRDE